MARSDYRSSELEGIHRSLAVPINRIVVRGATTSSRRGRHQRLGRCTVPATKRRWT
jgi:hypothetical protein